MPRTTIDYYQYNQSALWWVNDHVFQTISIMILTRIERSHNEWVFMSAKRMKQIRVLMFCHEIKDTLCSAKILSEQKKTVQFILRKCEIENIMKSWNIELMTYKLICFDRLTLDSKFYDV